MKHPNLKKYNPFSLTVKQWHITCFLFWSQPGLKLPAQSKPGQRPLHTLSEGFWRSPESLGFFPRFSGDRIVQRSDTFSLGGVSVFDPGLFRESRTDSPSRHFFGLRFGGNRDLLRILGFFPSFSTDRTGQSVQGFNSGFQSFMKT